MLDHAGDAADATADPDAAAIWRKNLDERRQAMTMFAAELASAGQLGVDGETAADVLWLAMDVRNYDWLVRERGWSAEQFHRWYVDTVAAAILARSTMEPDNAG
jgi:TetR/AcrR family transcriptional regulator of autoinduction and epiphytic fitness